MALPSVARRNACNGGCAQAVELGIRAHVRARKRNAAHLRCCKSSNRFLSHNTLFPYQRHPGWQPCTLPWSPCRAPPVITPELTAVFCEALSFPEELTILCCWQMSSPCASAIACQSAARFATSRGKQPPPQAALFLPPRRPLRLRHKHRRRAPRLLRQAARARQRPLRLRRKRRRRDPRMLRKAARVRQRPLRLRRQHLLLGPGEEEREEKGEGEGGTRVRAKMRGRGGGKGAWLCL